MKKSIFLIIFSIGVLICHGQDYSLIVNNCANSTACSPFSSGYVCQAANFRSTHGSPKFYVPETNPTKEIELLSAISSGGAEQSEGITCPYPFQADVEYKIELKIMGR